MPQWERWLMSWAPACRWILHLHLKPPTAICAIPPCCHMCGGRKYMKILCFFLACTVPSCLMIVGSYTSQYMRDDQNLSKSIMGIPTKTGSLQRYSTIFSWVLILLTRLGPAFRTFDAKTRGSAFSSCSTGVSIEEGPKFMQAFLEKKTWKRKTTVVYKT